MNWALAVIAAAAAAAVAPPKPAPLVTKSGVRHARQWAAQREGTVSFAVIGTKGRVRGYETRRQYPSASVAKAMLMVHFLREARDRPLSAYERAKLEPMIRMSRNPPARELFAQVGSPGLYEVAAAARMRDFSSDFSLFESQITAADQARFFLRIDRLMPRRHRGFGTRLLRDIIPEHRWGIPPAAQAAHLTPYFKGGWRSDVVHQVALLERPKGRRIALAVLSATTDQGYGRATVEGIARRVLRPWRDRKRGGSRGPSRRTGRSRRR